GLERHEVLYVGDSQSADVLGARNAGMPVAWLNRDGSPLREGVPQPDHEIACLSDLLSILT
ncbi:MAG: HAD family hydrolase, partial [Isosphaeraceae bacterium]